MTDQTITEFLLARIAEDEVAEIHDLATCTWANDTTAGVECDCGWLKRRDAECAAKRAIVSRYAVPDPHTPDEACLDCDVIHALAAVYADHPEFRSEWSIQ